MVKSKPEIAIDTTVLVNSNQPLITVPKQGSLFQRRLLLLGQIRDGKRMVLISKRLLAEYDKQIPKPRNDFLIAFFQIIDLRKCVVNYASWTHDRRAKARKCRYPKEDDHVLRTALRDHSTEIVSEEKRMLQSGKCIKREFRVSICQV